MLEESDQFRSAQRLYADLRARDVAVGLTTVYHAMEIFGICAAGAEG
ncbi:transcriptional repressor [Micromonospora sp. NPDC049230]